MSGDKFKKGGYGLRNNPDNEATKEISANGTDLTSDQHGDRVAGLDQIRVTMSEAVAAGMATLRAELKTDLQDFRSVICEDMKKQMDEFAAGVQQQLQETAKQVHDAGERIKQTEENMAELENWNMGVKNTFVQLLQNQWTLEDKISEMEGRARRNNIRIYGVPEDSEQDTSVASFAESFIKKELGDVLGQDCDLGIECAHRALGPKPPASAPPRSIIVHFLRFTVKEEILRAAWKKVIRIHNKQVYFDHDYAVEVQKRRKDYIPVKRALKEKGICFQTPLNKMRIFYASRSVLYNSATEAAEDLQRRGIATVQITAARNRAAQMMSEEMLKQLLPWETQRTRRGDFHKHIREKLSEFRQTSEEITAD
ncbi:uncharacterized protein KZ484_025023 isoform 1-T4 [Pholidichthys leucotaenia]